MAIISNFIDQLFINIFNLININQDIALFVALFIKVVIVILIIVIAVAYTTWLERKIHGLIHLRKGPNVVGAFGLLQPMYDGIKLIFKETIIPLNADKFIFFMAPILTFVIALLGWVVIPIDNGMAFSNMSMGALYLLAISSLSVYGLIMAGYSSNSQFSLLGAVRSSSQMISYELSMGMIVLCVALVSNSLNLNEIILKQQNLWNFITLFPLAILFFIVILAETNRHPFDLPEGEADIVGGFHTEYSGFLFALFFLAEYANMILMSSFFTILFLGGWLPLLNFYPFNLIPGFAWFIFKIIILLFFIIQVRAVLPRYRYDQLMALGWKVFLPITFFAFFVISLILRLNITN